MRDRGKSPAWLLVALIPVLGPLWLCVDLGLLRGTPGENQYGPDPLILDSDYLTVNIGARVAALAGPSEVAVSQTVRDLMVGSELVFHDRGARMLKGVPGEWRVYTVERSRAGAGS